MTESNSSNQESEIKNPHSQSIYDVLKQLKTDQESGLSGDEAKKRLESYGLNQLEEHDEKSLLQILIDQINNPIVYLLTAAAVLAFAQLWHVFDMREAEEPIFNNQVTRNKYIWGAVILCVIAIITSYFIPQINDVLSYQSLDLKVWILIGITSFLPIITIQTLKEITKGMKLTF